MATDATGTPTSLGIPKFNTSADSPSGLGTNAMMDSIDALIADRIEKPASPSTGDVLTWDGDSWEATEPASSASVTPIQLTNPWQSGDVGNSFWTVLTVDNEDVGLWQFSANVEGIVRGQVLIPEGVTSANIRLFIAANATTGVTRLTVSTGAVADGEVMWPTLDAAASQDITVPGTAYTRKDVVYAVPSTIAGGDLLHMRITHNGDHVNDTLAVNTLLLGAWLEPA